MSDAMSDLINLAIEQKPIDFQNAFNDIMSTKITSAVSAVKDQLSKDVFSGLVSLDDQEEVEEE
jgi:hypothetical protein